MRKIFLLLCYTAALCASADEPSNNEFVNLQAEVRLDYQRDWQDGANIKGNSGFEGKYLNFRVDGTITEGLTYSWRQRLNKPHKDASFFDATDWIYLNYDLGKWSIAGGKQIVCIGGWEYDRAPIDLYGCSVFWNNIPCYQIGGSVSLRPTSKDKITFQFCESPFYTSDNRNMYAYNMMWNSSHGFYESIWSANLIEYVQGRYITYIALGNKFTANKIALELDFMNRASTHQAFLFRDMSLMGELSYMPSSKWKLFAKMTYDVNNTRSDADLCVLPGTELKMVGVGIEFYPLLKKRHIVRLHANAFYSWGKNANAGDVMQNKTMLIDVGVKWKMNIFSFKH